MMKQTPFSIKHTFIPVQPVTGITFRLAGSLDLQPLRDNCYPEINWPQFQDHYEYLLKWQENGRCYILIAETDLKQKTPPTIIGSGQLIRLAEKAEIADLSVHPDYQNQGIGTAIIDVLTQIAGTQKMNMLEIGVEVENQAALRLYRRLGFGSERPLNIPNAQKAIILRKSLSQGSGDVKEILREQRQN